MSTTCPVCRHTLVDAPTAGENMTLRAKLAEAERERDEADRRAGAAERRMEDLADTRAKNASWIRKAKEQWGVIDNISFDVVWDEALKARDALTAANERNAKLERIIQGLLNKVNRVTATWRHHEKVNSTDMWLLVDRQITTESALAAAKEDATPNRCSKCVHDGVSDKDGSVCKAEVEWSVSSCWRFDAKEQGNG